MARVPLLGSQGVGRVINGPIPYAPDGNPMIGPMPGVPNAFEAHSFTFGIAQAGGAGKVAAEWIVNGETEWDMWATDPRRYTAYADDSYATAKGMEIYGHEYAMHFPHYEWPAGRNKKLSPVHQKLVESGAQFGVVNGWERANWFAKEGDDTSLEAAQTWNREGPWRQRIQQECENVRDNVGVLDMPGFSRYTLKGDGAAEWLRGQITGALPKVGRMTLGYFSDNRGRIVSEMSILRNGEDDFTLMTAAIAQWHDYESLANALPDDTSIELNDITEQVSVLIVTGPQSRALFEAISTADLSLSWLSMQDATIADKQVLLARVSFAGELGWEVHGAIADMPEIYDAVIAAGAKPFGMYALNSLRIEKGYRSWKGDLSTDYSMVEGGLERFVRINKPQNFRGKQAIAAELENGVTKKFVTLVLDDIGLDAPYMSTIWSGDRIIGEITSSAYGYRADKVIGLGIIASEFNTPGTEVEVEIYGKRTRAVVQEDAPLWDPENQRLRA